MDSAYSYNLSLENKNSQKTISEDINYKYVSNVIDYYKDKRVFSIRNDDNFLKELINNDKSVFEVPVIKTSHKIDSRNYSRASYRWVCYVTAINKDTFTANVKELRSDTEIFEEAEYEIQDLDDEDVKMLKIGAVFYWSMGFEYRNGTKKKESFIRFKRLPVFTEKQIDNALDLSNELFNDLNWVD